MGLVERFTFQHIDHGGGAIEVAQGQKDVPFEIRRVYYLHGVPPDQKRGGHAHKALLQIAVCVSGSCRFLLDNGSEIDEVVLSRPTDGIIIRPMIWREMTNFSPGAVLLVLASEHFDERDYIRDYAEFKRAFPHRP